jgi:hypothetical protein
MFWPIWQTFFQFHHSYGQTVGKRHRPSKIISMSFWQVLLLWLIRIQQGYLIMMTDLCYVGISHHQMLDEKRKVQLNGHFLTTLCSVSLAPHGSKVQWRSLVVTSSHLCLAQGKNMTKWSLLVILLVPHISKAQNYNKVMSCKAEWKTWQLCRRKFWRK